MPSRMAASIPVYSAAWMPAVTRKVGPGSAPVRLKNGQEYLRAPGDFDYPLTDELSSKPPLEARNVAGAALSVAPPTLCYWADPGLAAEGWLATRAGGQNDRGPALVVALHEVTASAVRPPDVSIEIHDSVQAAERNSDCSLGLVMRRAPGTDIASRMMPKVCD